jgi:hypothetical protein
MSEKLVEGISKNPEKVTKYIKELEKRFAAVMRYATHRVAMQARADVDSRGPTELGYDKNLEVLKVRSEDIGYVLAYVGKPDDISDVDGESAVFYFRPLKRKMGKFASIGGLLKKYGPFVKEMIPDNYDDTMVKIVYREVSPQEVDAVRKKNLKDEPELRAAFAKIGVKIPPKRAIERDKGFEVFSDLAFKVLRREYGIRSKSTPHWRPAIKKIVGGQVLDKVFASEMVQKALTDPNYPGWKRLGMIKGSIGIGELSEFDDFQKLILGKS